MELGILGFGGLKVGVFDLAFRIVLGPLRPCP